MGQAEPFGAQHAIAEEQQVEIDRARPPLLAAHAAHLLLDGDEPSQEGARREQRLHLHHRVEIAGLRWTQRLGLVDPQGAAPDARGVARESPRRLGEALGAVAEVSAQPDVAVDQRGSPPTRPRHGWTSGTTLITDRLIRFSALRAETAPARDSRAAARLRDSSRFSDAPAPAPPVRSWRRGCRRAPGAARQSTPAWARASPRSRRGAARAAGCRGSPGQTARRR